MEEKKEGCLSCKKKGLGAFKLKHFLLIIYSFYMFGCSIYVTVLLIKSLFSSF